MDYKLETFKTLERVRFGRSNLLAANYGGSMQHLKRELGRLRNKGLLSKPRLQEDNKNYRSSSHIYELTPTAEKLLKQQGFNVTRWDNQKNFWHRLMIADIMLLVEIACKQRGLTFRHRQNIIGDKPLQFETHVSHEFPKHVERYDGALQPDELFAINNTCFVLEADRQTEPIYRDNFKASSYLRKILQYREVLKSGSYKELIPNMVVLNITTSVEHARNIKNFVYDDMGMKSKSMLFMGLPILGTHDDYPRPRFMLQDEKPDEEIDQRRIDLLDLPFERAGFDPFIIGEEVI